MQRADQNNFEIQEENDWEDCSLSQSISKNEDSSESNLYGKELIVIKNFNYNHLIETFKKWDHPFAKFWKEMYRVTQNYF